MKQYRGVLALGATASLVGLLVGCSGSSSPKAEPTTGTTPSVPITTASPGASGTGACKYVSKEQASALAGSSVKAGRAESSSTGGIPFQYCHYVFDPGNAPGVVVGVADLGANANTLYAQFRASKQSGSDYQIVSGVGDEAFFAGQNLYIRKGSKGVIVFVGRNNGSPRGLAGLPDEKALAALVLAKL